MATIIGSQFNDNDTVNGIPLIFRRRLVGTLLNDSIFGLAGNDILEGLAGNDLLDGGTGNDTMRGGIGNDTYIVDAPGDVVIELAGQGIDEVRSSISYTLPLNVENLMLLGTANINGTGNALNNVINGNSGNNFLFGLAGNDTLNGGDGNDYLDGGTGNDTMNGGFGDDTYIVDSAGDVAGEVAGGIDLVIASVSHTLSLNLENLNLSGVANINGTGNAKDNIINGNAGNNFLFGLAGNDTINGGAGNDYLDGGAGIDTLRGGAGNDTYIVDSASDVVVELAGQGIDEVRSFVSHTLSANVENLTLLGAANINGTGNTLNNIINGNAGNNFLFGLAGNDIINGGAGNDYLDGGVGIDTLRGGAGNDTYIVDSASDVVVELAGQGIDEVRSFVSHTLSANVENLTLLGAANINGTGNDLNNVINGNAGNNFLFGLAGNDTLNGGDGNDLLSGGLGNDTMNGGFGDDTYIVDSLGDVAAEVAGGIDLVIASVSHTLSANLENLNLSGVANINGTGNFRDNVINGNSGNNVLSGLGGNDTLVGGSGSDTLLGGDGNDRLRGGTTANNAGERDIMTGGLGADTFELGNSAGSYYLNTVGNSYASITDFSAFQLDKFQVKGALSQYRLDKTRSLEGGAALDTLIYRGNDLIAVVRDTTNVLLGRDFVVV
ncbi:calcium-binding protein [Thermoleptolyngbya sichuanensis A183]|uniref:Calcium-binding protein n=1 Tax=Thermoleptolyngbya sichuanensis A183 TaxID=2737172 RepID=A0A6M8BHN0_9CYAN|nr:MULTISPECIES: calcium-binding protein [Thermoleptolyngbya]QKD84367.1 calcium-binding protein [Thermoleptolyngbya sichuanensis A183]